MSNYFYRIVPKSNVIVKTQDGLDYVIKTILCNVEGYDDQGNQAVIKDLITILPEPKPGTFTEFQDITKDQMISWITEIDTINFENVKKSLEIDLKAIAEKEVIVDGKLPWE